MRLSVRLAHEDNQAYYQRLDHAFRDYGTHEGYPAPTFVILGKRP